MKRLAITSLSLFVLCLSLGCEPEAEKEEEKSEEKSEPCRFIGDGAKLCCSEGAKLDFPSDLSVEDAIRNARVSQRPRLITAQGVFRARSSDLVIMDEDADFIRNNPRITQIINRAGVMIVVAE